MSDSILKFGLDFMKHLFLIFFAFSIALFSGFRSNVLAQSSNEVSISFVPLFNNQPVILPNEEEEETENDSIQIDKFLFYVSLIELYNEEELVFQEENSFHLIDAADTNSLALKIKIPENLSFTRLDYLIGIDSLTNVSGAMGGDLDPTKGMYWTWQSGYINFKLEGTAENCPARKNKFQFHLGGYQQPYYAIQKVQLSLNELEDIRKIKVEIDLDDLLLKLNLTETYQIMSPNEEAMFISKLLPALFSISK